MNNLWIYLSLAAGSLQTVRNATSKTLASKLKPNSVTLVRFGYAVPFTLLYVLILYFLKFDFGSITQKVILLSVASAILQATANFLLITLFKLKSFAIAINFMKSDNIFAAIFGILLFGQFISLLGWVAILISIFGIIIANFEKEKKELENVPGRVLEKSIALGLGSGALFALSSFTVKFANSSYQGGVITANSALTLLMVLIIQTTFLFVYIFFKDKDQINLIMKNSKTDSLVGFTSAAGSVCWFLAFSLTQVAYVRTVGQIEAVLTILLSYFFFKEKLTQNNWIGMGVTLLGIILLAFVV